MYESFYGLKEKPFSLTPDPAFFFLSHTHKNAYSHLQYAVKENKGFVVITGEIGAGKTTLIRYLLKNARMEVTIGLINNTRLFPKQMLKLICREFEIKVDGVDTVDLQETFYNFLLNEYAHRKRVVLIIDEAQNLPAEALEELRMLSNLESDKNHLLQIILIGQPGLKDILKKTELEQFTQRITVSYHLGRLNGKDVRDYINFRLKAAGAANAVIFKPEAVDVIYKYSKGIPRVINIICDAAMLYGYANDQRQIGDKLIMDVINDRKKSGIYDSSGKMVTKREAAAGLAVKEGRTEMETSMALIEKQLQIMEGRLMRIESILDEKLLKMNRDMEMIARRDELALEMMKLLKENIRRRMKMARAYADNEDKIEEQPAKRKSIFGKKK